MDERRFGVMVVEDEVVPAEYLASIISDDARFVVEAIVPSAAKALEVLERKPIDLIFMDIMIEGPLSGAELALKIHQHRPEILMIFATAYSDDEMTDYAAEAGAFAYLLKPYRPRQIAATLKLAATRLEHPGPAASPSVIALTDGYSYSLNDQRLQSDGRPVKLSAKEQALIDLLVHERHRTLRPDVIAQQLGLSNVSLRALIYRLRKITSPHLIQNLKRSGYRIGLEASPHDTPL